MNYCSVNINHRVQACKECADKQLSEKDKEIEKQSQLTERLVEALKKVQSRLLNAQRGDPNGGKAYQTSKIIDDALSDYERSKRC